MPTRDAFTCLTAPGPKKILACDGGGIRGLISVEILAKLEGDLRIALDRPDLVLGDWFDFVCGTSTGAIIAACISAGMSMDEIRRFYVDSGKDMFEPSRWLDRAHHKYDDTVLAETLRTEFNRALGEPEGAKLATLGHPRLRTLLMMVMCNLSTDSPWPVSNNPRSKYNDPDHPDCNLKLPLWQLVRGSAAAPTYFRPEEVIFREGTSEQRIVVFVDGGVTTYNNPAFLAFQMATAAPYHMDWATGEDQLLIVSVGTGAAAHIRPHVREADLTLLNSALHVPGVLMNAAGAGWDMACRTVGACRFGGAIDREFGDMVQAPGTQATSTVRQQFAYIRYDADTSATGLRALGLSDITPASVHQLDSVAAIADLRRIGAAYAARHVSRAHLAGFLR